jgi:hypothetical protein
LQRYKPNIEPATTKMRKFDEKKKKKKKHRAAP